MQPLGENKRQNEMDMNLFADAQQGSFVVGTGNSRLLPRFVRKAIRFAQGLTPVRLVKSRGVQIVTASFAVIVGSGYFIQTADKNSMLSSASSHMGFEASKLVVNGNQNLDINVLQARLATQLGNSLFSFKVDAARDEVLNDPWVKSCLLYTSPSPRDRG